MPAELGHWRGAFDDIVLTFQKNTDTTRKPIYLVIRRVQGNISLTSNNLQRKKEGAGDQT